MEENEQDWLRKIDQLPISPAAREFLKQVRRQYYDEVGRFADAPERRNDGPPNNSE